MRQRFTVEIDEKKGVLTMITHCQRVRSLRILPDRVLNASWISWHRAAGQCRSTGRFTLLNTFVARVPLFQDGVVGAIAPGFSQRLVERSDDLVVSCQLPTDGNMPCRRRQVNG